VNSFYKEQIEKVLKDERCAMTINQIVRKTGLPQGDIGKALNHLVDEGQVTVCDGYYSWDDGTKSEKAEYVPNVAPSECPDATPPVSGLTCTVCGKVCANPQGLGSHKSRVHGKTAKKKPEHTPLEHVCTVCGAGNRTAAALDKHRKKHHEGNFICPECGLHFPSKVALAPHVRFAHKVKPTNANVTIPVGEVRMPEGATLTVNGEANVKPICFGSTYCGNGVGCSARVECTQAVLDLQEAAKAREPKLFMAVDPEPPASYNVPQFAIPACFGHFRGLSDQTCPDCAVMDCCENYAIALQIMKEPKPAEPAHPYAAPHLMDDPLDAIYEIVARAREARKDGWTLTADISINIDSKGESTMFTLSMDKVSP
jgi:hypothetical protein